MEKEKDEEGVGAGFNQPHAKRKQETQNKYACPCPFGYGMAYITKSLPLAAFLYAEPKIEFIGVNHSDPENIHFEFKPTEKAKKLIDSYYTGKATCNPRDLFESYKTLKDLIFEVKSTRAKEKTSEVASGGRPA